MNAYTINIGPRSAPRLSFPVMADSWDAAYDQHVDLAQPDERIEILPLWTDKRSEQNEAAALALQQARPDVLTLAVTGGLTA